MLSVCIPVHNKNITQLLIALRHQVPTVSDLVEILVLNDGSIEPIIDKGLTWDGIRVLSNEVPLGRSAARNQLVLQAKGPYILFLDSGTEIIKKDFLKHWLVEIEASKTMVYFGGSIYTSNPPEKNYQLRWKVGVARESQSFAHRKKYPTSFKTNNTVIHQRVFMSLKFEERLVQYGHEDTLYGFELSELGIRIHQVDNPVLNQLKDHNETFLNKTTAAVENLLLALECASSPNRFKQEVKLLQSYDRLKGWRMIFLLSFMETILLKSLRSRLLKGPKFLALPLYDLYKLLWLNKAVKSHG